MFAFLKKYDVHLCPEVHGRITLEGKPLPGLDVYRSLTYGDDDELLEKELTDADGRFSFPEKNIRSRKPGSMFDESSIRQIIDVDYDGKRYLLWGTLAIGIIPNKALSEKLMTLNCEIQSSDEKRRFPSIEYPQANHLVRGVCRW
ncbi:DUF4198 domain-containing protein [Psychromonas antarctica]|uniref:DUF4198 domain-containing protein n=1 Tax=Psychromonas antarctica TaxID=67573 RepID=UPI001EE8EF2B|nr:DUF4198 domain-containing protein [Psychromonas antarctica]MCG6202834.1 DUF4198 domain-containing protein [Psychromonas antarctica]